MDSVQVEYASLEEGQNVLQLPAISSWLKAWSLFFANIFHPPFLSLPVQGFLLSHSSTTGKKIDFCVCSFTERKSWRPIHSFSSVRFAKITSIMILLGKEKMWLLKMDLWKMAFLKDAIWTILSSPQKFSPSFIHFKRSVFVCKSESHNARGILKFPVCKLLRLIWFLWGLLHQGPAVSHNTKQSSLWDLKEKLFHGKKIYYKIFVTVIYICKVYYSYKLINSNPHKVIQCPWLCNAGHSPPHGSRLAPYVMSSRVGQAWHKAQVDSQWRMCALRGVEVLKPEGLSLALSPWARYHLLPFPSPAGLSFIPRPGCPNRPDDWAFPVFQTHHATVYSIASGVYPAWVKEMAWCFLLR